MSTVSANHHASSVPSFDSTEQSQNILRILTMLEKAVMRVVRRTYPTRPQYPEIVGKVERYIHRLRTWIQWVRTYHLALLCAAIHDRFVRTLSELRGLIQQVIAQCDPPGEASRAHPPQPSFGPQAGSRRHQNHHRLCRAIAAMQAHLERFVDRVQAGKAPQGVVGEAIDTALQKAFELYASQPQTAGRTASSPAVSQRGEQTYIFPCATGETYHRLISDARQFRREVVAPLGACAHPTGHKPDCPDHSRYILRGFRHQGRKVVTVGGRRQEYPIRMIQCAGCQRTFSLLPSFLAREKHFSLKIIGHAVRKMGLFGQSLAATLSDLTLLVPGGHSKQTLLDWLTWFGTQHPATLLTRAGIQGSGYFQEDEGFEKEACLRTYSVVMLDPETLLVWHADYVDHVDAETLARSFEDFVQHLSFTVLGVTKDKWHPATQALKRVFRALWIAFCHRHYLDKLRQALRRYQAITQCADTTRHRLYDQIKTILDTAASSVVLKLRLKALTDQAFAHPLLRHCVEELRNNAVHYTCPKKRKGLRPTTSLVDNFLKTVKRKLRQVESFRDQTCTRALFRAMANLRNFVPFLSGAKHAHNSPFMLAGGDTFDLPWEQVMNMHNAFLFAAGPS